MIPTRLTMTRWAPVICFFMSGFCSLLYQIVWLRLAFAHFGVITAMTSVVVSVFMLGLALGSWIGGRVGYSTGSIVPYCVTELLIAAGAWAVPALYVAGDRIFLPAGLAPNQLFLRASLCVVGSLLPWCVAMGATFPLMMGYLRTRTDSTRSFSYLYAANVFGACTGILVTAAVLIECLGFHRTLALASAVNVVAAGLAWKTLGRSTPSFWQASPSPHLQTTKTFGVDPLYAVLFVTGLVAMGLEMVWIRAFAYRMLTSIYAFAAVLFVYLLASFAGTAYYRRDKSGSLKIPGMLLLSGALALLPLVATDPRLHCGKIFLLSSIIPVCFALGRLTPHVMDTLARGDPFLAGRGYAVNAAGCIVGPLLVAYVLLPRMSVNAATIILSAILWMTCAGFFYRETSHVSLLGSLFLLLSSTKLWGYEQVARLIDPGCWIRRDATANVLAIGRDRSKLLFVNGVGLTGLTSITQMMAHLPMGIRKEPPKKVLVICFGMGTTFRSALSWSVPTTAVELVPSVKEVFPYFWDDAHTVLSNPLGHIVIDDGRRYLRNTTDRFDLITLDPPPPVETAASSLLYSEDFYALAKQHLTPEGILEQWFPSGEKETFQAILRSLQNSFPHVLIYRSIGGWGYQLLASQSEIVAPAPTVFWDRLPAAAKSDFLTFYPNQQPQKLVEKLFSRPVAIEKILADDSGRTVTDDKPYSEYFLLRRIRDLINHRAVNIT